MKAKNSDILFLAKVFALYFLFNCNAQASEIFVSEMCNAYNIVAGNGGKAFAAFAVISVGIGFFTGKVSWGLLVGVSVGVGSIFGAPSIVAAISGEPSFVCQATTYHSSCLDGSCSSCPTGFTGITCDSCSVGYTGANCDTCDNGYMRIIAGGPCLKKCTLSASGLSSREVDPEAMAVSVACDLTNFTGSVTYTCTNGVVAINNNSCVCSGHYTGATCSSCVAGYVGSSCSNCDTGYTSLAGGICQKDCSITGWAGIIDGTPVYPPSGSITCNDTPIYSGALDYTCSGGTFNVSSGSCVSARCTGGAMDSVSSPGSTIHRFASAGSFNLVCSQAINATILVVGGGGGGGFRHAGGGGGGGFFETTASLPAGNYAIIVGTGGNGSTGSANGSKGGSSSFAGYSVVGGGGGGTNSVVGNSGGSGGGGSNGTLGGAGTAGQGNRGGNQNNGNGCCFPQGGGGGGAGAAGGDTSGNNGTGGSNKAVRTGFHASMPSALTIEFTGIGSAVGACAGIVFERRCGPVVGGISP